MATYTITSPTSDLTYAGSDSNYDYYLDDGGNVYQVPRRSQQTNLPPFITGNTSTTGSSGGYIQQGQSWLNDLLNFGLGLAALGNRGSIQGGAINPINQQPLPNYNYGYSPEQLAAIRAQQERSAGGQFGASVEQFIKNNSGILLLAGLGVVLWKSGRK